MDWMARAFGLGGITKANDELRPNTADGTTQWQTIRATAADESWNIIMAEHRGRQAAVTQTQETAEPSRGQHEVPPPQGPQMGLQMVHPAQHPPPQQQEEYSGIGNALKFQAQLIHEPLTIMADLLVQRDVQDNAVKQNAFREFATNYTQMRIYIAMVGEQKTITMIHTIGAYYSIRSATNAYQGKIMGFIRDRRATKEPTPICLPQVKAWQWYTGQVNADKEDFMTTRRRPTGTNGGSPHRQ
jgi:hypothetical protein